MGIWLGEDHAVDRNEDDKLPLHDEAEARGKWRGDETIVDRGSRSGGLPASEVDEAATPDEGSDEGTAASRTAPWTGLSPPD